MKLHIVFTNDNGKYYVEEVVVADDSTYEAWRVDKTIDETTSPNRHVFEEVRDELGNPTVKDNHQFLLVKKLT